jgi:NTE family protein
MVIYKPIPKKQRALVLQGGVALGAYEAGVIQTLCKEISEQIKSDKEKNQNIFDIVAGTSIGAINAAILVSGAVDRRKKLSPKTTLVERWQYSAENLVKFWQNHLSSSPSLYNWWPYTRDPKLWVSTWDERHRLSDSAATGEAARRYFSAKEFFYAGAPHVFSAAGIQRDDRFFDNLYPPTNSWHRYSNSPLKESLEEFGYFPLATTFNNNNNENRGRDNEKGFSYEPRLLTVAVDVADGVAVTFDSYSKETTYNVYNSESKQHEERIIRYEGLMPEHVMASASFPLYFEYQKIAGRQFWDGGLLSNTPLRELISKHKTYWENYIGEQNLSRGMWNDDDDEEEEENGNANVPDLEVYIINVWPSREDIVPSDYEGIKDRKNDIGHADKTEYDQKVALLVSDYIDLIREMRKIALDHITQPNKQKDFKEKLDRFLKAENIESKQRTGKPRKYEDLIKGRFKLSKVITIERKDDRHSISNKWADFSSKTIADLIQEGQKYEKTSIVKTL